MRVSLASNFCFLLHTILAYELGSYTNKSDPYYGQSPPVYPSPASNGRSNSKWTAAYANANAQLSQMTLEEKVNVTQGFPGKCVGMSGSVPRLGWEPLCFSDGPDGIRGQEGTSAFPAGIHVAATFDRSLMYAYGVAVGEEFRGKGANFYLGPVAGPLGRIARGGRNWEGLSPDPYLAGAGMGEITRGAQDAGTIACAKHWLLNEQEFRRRPGLPLGEAISANVDDRTVHELYTFPFMNALREGVASVMCSYNRINNSYGCQNSKLLNGILKTELGFEGVVISDWNAQHAGVASAKAGLDHVEPDSGFWGGNLTQAVKNGSVSTERLDDMVLRNLAPYFYVGQDSPDYPPADTHPSTQKVLGVNVQTAAHSSLIREMGSAGTVLVKNINNALPLQNPTFLNVYGYDADVKASPWTDAEIYGGTYEDNWGKNTFNGTLISAWGSGVTTPGYLISPFHAMTERMAKVQGTLRWDFFSENPTPAYVNADACLVFINAYAGEKWDRVSLTDEFSDNLVKNVAANCTNTIVVIHSAGIRVVDAWIEHPNVTAVLFAGLPGQESGNSLADILWGDVNPSGRLPYTVACNESDYGHLLNSTVSFDAYPQDNFTEGVYIDYRAFDKQNIKPRFEFGFGLSYTTFHYADLTISAPNSDIAEYPDPSIKIIQGGHPQLWEILYNVSISVTNTGKIFGHDVPQLYIGIPDAPVRQLRGFERVPLETGGTKTVTFPLTRRDLSVWDVVAQQWRLQEGEYGVWVGASSRDLRLEGTLSVGDGGRRPHGYEIRNEV